jgi:hypothetical protein
VPTDRQSRTGPKRAAPVRLRRKVLPYETSRARPIERANAEGGPSTLPQSVPSIDQPTGQPSGEKIETAPDAAKKQKHTEENKTLVSDFYHSHILRASD